MLGATHQGAGAATGELVGTTPRFFFIPDHAEELAAEAGLAAYHRRFTDAWEQDAILRRYFVATEVRGEQKQVAMDKLVEGRFPKATIADLKERGHRVTVMDDWSLGRLSAAVKDGNLLKAAANPRLMQGYAVGR